MKRFLIFTIFIVFLAGCAPDPRRAAEADKIYAEADAIRVQTERSAISAAEGQRLQAELNNIQLADEKRKQQVKDAALANMKLWSGRIAWVSGIALSLAVVLVICSVAQAARITITGLGEATARAAMVKANLVYLDQKTGQYPVLLEYVSKGVYSMTDINTGITLMLDTRNEPDRLMIQTAGAVRHVGVLASHAERSNDPTGVAMIQPLIIENVEAQ